VQQAENFFLETVLESTEEEEEMYDGLPMLR
jgi:hypothetical protein